MWAASSSARIGLLPALRLPLGDADGAGVQLPERRVGLDLLVEQRLGDRRVVHLAVAVPAEADQVHHHVALEGEAVVDRELRHPRHGVRVLAVDVEDRHRQPARHVRGEAGGVEGLGLGGEADHVVDDDVHRAAHPVAGELGHVQRLGEHPLAGEGGVAVEDDREHPVVAPLVAEPHLLGPHAAERHGIDRLQVARVRDQMDVDLVAVAAGEVAGRAHVVLDVAAAEGAARIDVLEAGEDLGGGAADGVHHHVQPAAVAHRDDHLLGAALGGALEHLVEAGEQRLDPLDREALGAEIAGLQELLEGLGPGEQVEDALAVEPRGLGLHALLDPAPALGIGDVHELDADRAAVVPPAVLGGRGVGVLEAGLRLGLDAVHGIQIRQQVAQPAVGVQSLLVQRGGALGRKGRGGGYGLHNTVRIPQLARGAGAKRGRRNGAARALRTAPGS